MADCIFCKIVKGEIPCKKSEETEHFLAFHDIKPQAPAHILIIPKQHIARISELQNCHISLMGEMLLLAATIARQQGFEQDGYRLVLNCGENAGQEVFHIHLHLLAGRKFAWPPG